MAALFKTISVVLILELGHVLTQEFCGQKEPVVEKLCVSLRLPWQNVPIYFCTEKGKINYRNKCKSTGTYCPPQEENTLQISTPWDCCPITSQPDPCANAKCPPAPFNRTCSEYFTDSYWDCCPHYYCEAGGGSRETCHIKKLEPGCTSPRKEQENCTAFIDPHGCCNKYQCEQDTKAGSCPTMKHQTYVGTPIKVMGRNFTLMNSSVNLNGDTTFNSSGSSNFMLFPPTRYSIVSFGSLLQCVGDYTCPNHMKCCSVSPSYAEVPGGRRPTNSIHSLGRNPHYQPIHGYCMESVKDEKN